jgi:capsular exopolysaccharide synthesis family protein
VISFGEGYMESQLYYPTRYALLTSRTYVDRLLRAKEGPGGTSFPMWDWLTWSAYGAPEPKADAAENLGPAVDARAFEDVVGLDGPAFARRFAFSAYGPPARRDASSPWADPRDLAPFLAGKTTVKPEKGTTLVEISLEGERKDVLAPLANLLIEVFSREQRSESQRRLERERQFWRERRAELTSDDPERRAGAPEGPKGRLQVAADRLAEWKRRHQLDAPALEALREQLRSRLQQTEERLFTATDALVAANPVLDALVRRGEVEAAAAAAAAREPAARENGGPGGTAPTEGADAREQALDRAWLAALGRVAETANGMSLDEAVDGPFHRLPFVTSDKAFSETTAKLAAETAGGTRTYVIEHRRQRNRIARDLVLQTLARIQEPLHVRVAMRERKAADEAALRTVWSQTEELEGLQAEVDRQRAVLQTVDERLNEIRSQYEVERDTRPLRVIETAKDPGQPVRPNRPLLLVLGGGLGLLLGVGIALFLELMDDTVSTPEDVERHARAPLVGTIADAPAKPGEEGASPDRISALRPRSPVSEAYRALRTAVEFLGPDGGASRVLLVTSATPQEGKTTVASNLATVLAQDGKRTLLVDADLRKPRVHRVFGLEGAVGLTNVLVGRASLEDAVVAVEPEGLFVLPCGAIPPNPAELLGRPGCADLFRRLGERYDRVVVDSPPVGVVTDAAVLARNASHTLLVVSAGETKKRAVDHASAVLRGVGVPPSGVVLNNVRRGARWLYGPYDPASASYYGTDDRPSGGGESGGGPRA